LFIHSRGYFENIENSVQLKLYIMCVAREEEEEEEEEEEDN
jgi:hypothetical protein